jgi:polyhydroxyalkanoate synthase subunit PhaC
VSEPNEADLRVQAERALGVPSGLESIDPIGLARSLTRALGTAPLRPARTARTISRFVTTLASAAVSVTIHAFAGHAQPAVAPAPADRRFAHVAWNDNVGFFALKQAYLAHCAVVRDLVADTHLDAPEQFKASFGASLFCDALSPTNLALTNPAVLERALETAGRSMLRGASYFVKDVITNDGLPRRVDRGAFKLGASLAATPGDVIYRNELIELIQYRPTTRTVHEIPLLVFPPWINRYYIVDLSPGRSLVQWAVDHGITVFAVSYRNPDASMADVTFADYLRSAARAALDVVQDVTGAQEVNTLAVCLGGTLSVVLMAYLAAKGEGDLVRSATLLNSLTDHAGAGALSNVFVDKRAIARIERSMRREGYLDARQLSRAFDLLRANDLIFRPFVSAWLMGESPPAFDLLAWNADATRLPAAMHSFYLRHFWLNNDFARGALRLDGELLSPNAVKTDCYVVGAEDDHIVPWASSYRTTQLLEAPCRFVLSSGGHVAGIVNPPGPKARMRVADACPPTAQDWLARAEEVQATWWQDWIEWLTARSGSSVPASASRGNERFAPLCEAPGVYAARK